MVKLIGKAIAKAIGTTDARAIGYFQTLDNGKGTIDNSSASVEGMSVYLKKLVRHLILQLLKQVY